jgi:hypothetical protein
MYRIPAVVILSMVVASGCVGRLSEYENRWHDPGGKGNAPKSVTPTVDSPDPVTDCGHPFTSSPAEGACSVTGNGASMLIHTNVVTPSGLLQGGYVRVGADGNILCASCDCTAGAEGDRVLE